MSLTWTPDYDTTLGVAEPARVMVNLTPDTPGPPGPQGAAGISNGAETSVDLGSGSGARTLDFSTGSVFTLTLTGTTQVAVSNLPAGKAATVVVILKQDATGSRTVSAWPTGTKWSGGSLPPLSTPAAAVDIATLFTPDGGTTWYGGIIGWRYQ